MQSKIDHTIFLTGATGFIGSHVAECFLQNGENLVCSARTGSNTSFLETLPVTLLEVDLEDEEVVSRSLGSTDFVIHTAGLVNDWSSYNDFYNANVVCTRNIMQACVKNGIRDVIITGTNASYGEENAKEVKSESSPASPNYPYFLNSILPSRINHYRVTKHLATMEAIATAREHSINLTVLEPVWVYGEREFSSGFYEYMKTIKEGIPFFPGSRKNYFHAVYAGDLARAYYQAYLKRLEGIHRILIGNDPIHTMQEIYGVFCREMGIKKPTNLPKALVYPVGLMMEIFAELFKSKNPPLLSRSRVNMFYDNIQYNIEKAKSLLAFQQTYSLEEGIARTVNWYKNNNLI